MKYNLSFHNGHNKFEWPYFIGVKYFLKWSSAIHVHVYSIEVALIVGAIFLNGSIETIYQVCIIVFINTHLLYS